jgi:hypothetical protein
MRWPQTRIEMTKFLIRPRGVSRENGQTIALVAVSMLSLVAMAAIAIDLTTLYVARGEIQRAADATALAAAKAFVDSGVTTHPGNTGLQNVARAMAGDFAAAVLPQNNVVGVPAQFASGSPAVNFNVQGNPQVTVRLERTGLPIFFARIWGNSTASVSATAIAEAYNPAYAQTNTGAFLPSAPKCVKPFLVPNTDVTQSIRFVDPSTGAVNNSGNPFIGERLVLSSACKGGGPGCILQPSNPNPHPQAGEYLPMLVPDSHQYCPSNSALGCAGNSGTDFERSIECCDGSVFDFPQCGTSGTAAFWDTTTNPQGPSHPARSGLQCLIHTNNPGPPTGIPEQDTINLTALLSNAGPQISPGTFSQARYSIQPGSLASTSDSIITVPLFDNRVLPPPQQLTVVGFLQLFVNYTGPGVPSVAGSGQQGAFDTYILNVIGCGSAGPGPAVSGGGASPIPVRLIHN